jgi:hypothetical protein
MGAHQYPAAAAAEKAIDAAHPQAIVTPAMDQCPILHVPKLRAAVVLARLWQDQSRGPLAARRTVALGALLGRAAP